MTEAYDLVAIGAGLAGESAAELAAFYGRRAVVIEKAILIASGSRPVRPESVPFNDPGVCDSNTILALGYIPKDILIAGGGPVGVEYATICHALGARVTLAHMADRLMPMMDREMSRRYDQPHGGRQTRSLVLNRRQTPAGHDSVRRRTRRQYGRTGTGCRGRKDRRLWLYRRR